MIQYCQINDEISTRYKDIMMQSAVIDF